MRITIKKIFIFALVFVTIISLIVINSFATTLSNYSSCAEHYFQNLTNNDIPINAIGSCAYTATAMLLAYYDAYWNDNFISDIYERDVLYDSVLNEFGSGTFKTENELLFAWYDEHTGTDSAVTPIDPFVWRNYIKQNYTGFASYYRHCGFLHLDLIGMGEDSGYYSGVFQTEKYGASVSDIAKILDDYFDPIFGYYRYYDPLHLNDVSGEIPPINIKILDSENVGTSHSDVISKLYELTNNHIPVMYQGTESVSTDDDEKGSHMMIAYNPIKNEMGNIVDCTLHTGHISNPQTTLTDTIYDSDIAILWLEIDKSRIPHVHCDNYVEGNNRYCSCQVYGYLHESHVHESDGVYIGYDADNHTTKCKWDDRPIQSAHVYDSTPVQYSDAYHVTMCGCGNAGPLDMHNFVTYIGAYPQGHLYACECGYQTYKPHPFTYQKESDTTHTATCECGYVLTNQEHFYGNYEHYSSIQHKVYCPCGQYMRTETHLIEAINNRYSTCLECGAVFDSWSVPSIKNSEEDEPHERE